MGKSIVPVLIAAGLGALSWLLVEPAGVDQEHWDNPLYWRYAYTGICLGCAVLGYFFSRLAWTYGIVAVWVQGLPLLLANLDAELLAVSAAMLALISVPPALAGVIGAGLGRRFAQSRMHSNRE